MSVRASTTGRAAGSGPSVRPTALDQARRPDLLQVAAEAFVTRPTASLAEVAHAAGIGRTTLHKQYATREDLVVAVAHRGLDLLHEAIADAALDPEVDDPEVVGTTLEQLVASFVPLGAQLAFLLRQPSLEDEPEVMERLDALDPPLLDLVHRGKTVGLLRADVPDRWIVSTLYAQTYVAWEAVTAGWLAAHDAPDLVIRSVMEGLCADGGDRGDRSDRGDRGDQSAADPEEGS